MASEVEICNRALQKLGAGRINSLSDNSPEARACALAYPTLRLLELRKHRWAFAIKRADLAAEVPAPTWGKGNAFPLPADYLRLIPDYPERNYYTRDDVIEDGRLLTNDSSPKQIRYIADVTDPNKMDPAFREALSTKIALELCEQITQSNTKKEALREDYKEAVKEARRANAIESVAHEPAEDSFITVRR